MAYDLQHFVNREVEINTFRDLLNHHRRRILLIHGPELIGKSSVLPRLRQLCKDPQTISAFVDFRDRTLLESNKVIHRLRELIGGTFAERLGQTEAQIQRDFVPSFMSVSPLTIDSIAWALSPLRLGSSADVSLSANVVQIGGDVVGRDKISISNSSITVNPSAGSDWARMEIETRRNTAFRAAVADLLVEQRMILFFDHFEQATEEVAHWLRQHVLSFHLDEEGQFHNLWVIITGRRLPLQGEADQWRHVLHTHLIEPLSREAITLFWVGKRGLSNANMELIIQLSRGKPGLLCLMANNLEEVALGESQ